MLNGSIMVPLESTAGGTQHPAQPAWQVLRDLKSSCATIAHHALLILGAVAIGTLVLMFIKPELADHIQQLSPYSSELAAEADDAADADPLPLVLAAAEPAPPAAALPVAAPAGDAKPVAGADPQQQRVTQWLSRRYRVAYDATKMLVAASYSTAGDMKLDPLLILAVMAIESGLNPFAESPVGAQGLMQVMSKVHHEKFQNLGGVKAALNPVANIKVGALILKDYVTRSGSVEGGLKMYVGAAAFDSDAGYGSKVLAEYRRLKDVAAGKKVPTMTARATPKPRPAQPAAGEVPAEAENRATPQPQPQQSQLSHGQGAAQTAAL